MAPFSFLHRLQSAAVDIFSVTHLDDGDRTRIVIYRIHDAMSAMAYPITVMTGQFLGSRRSRVLGKGLNSIDDLLADFLLRDGL